MEPNNQKTTSEPAFSNIPINPHTPQVISPTTSQAAEQPAHVGYEDVSVSEGESDFKTSITVDPPPALPMVPISNQSGGKWFDRFKKKKFLVPGAGVLAALLFAGVVLGWYLPNQPQNVYNTGLDRTGEVAEKLILEGFDRESLETIKQSELTGKVEANGKDISFSTDFNSKYDEKYSDSFVNAKYKFPEDNEKSIGVKFLTETLKGRYYPNIYFQLTGLNAFGLEQFAPGLSEYDGKWISATSDYLESAIPASDEDGEKPGEFTYEDAAELAKVITAKTREYVFTSDKENSVVVQKSFVGTEKMEDGITANRYKIGLNKANLKKYCAALIEGVYSTKAYKKLPGGNSNNIDEDKKSSIKSCQDNVEEDVKEENTYDLWVDKKYKLIHKVRVTDKDDASSYVEAGQKYKGKDDVPLFVNVHSDKENYDGKFTLVLNTKTDVTKGTFSFNQQGVDWLKLDGSLEFKPFKGELKIEKPANAVPIQEVLQKLGFGDYISGGGAGGGTVMNNAQDSERKGDIRALQSKTAEYYALNGYYPNLAQLNNSTFRTTNGIPEEATKDPAGTTTVLAKQSVPGQYGYNPTDCGASGMECQAYTLTATLSDGTLYEIKSP